MSFEVPRPGVPLTIFICDGCGKLSRAARKPGAHSRFAGRLDELPEAVRPFIIRIEPKYAGDGGIAYEDAEDGEGEVQIEVCWVKCGPFRQYDAFHVEDKVPRPMAPPDRVQRPYTPPTAPRGPVDDAVPF